MPQNVINRPTTLVVTTFKLKIHQNKIFDRYTEPYCVRGAYDPPQVPKKGLGEGHNLPVTLPFVDLIPALTVPH